VSCVFGLHPVTSTSHGVYVGDVRVTQRSYPLACSLNDEWQTGRMKCNRDNSEKSWRAGPCPSWQHVRNRHRLPRLTPTPRLLQSWCSVRMARTYWACRGSCTWPIARSRTRTPTRPSTRQISNDGAVWRVHFARLFRRTARGATTRLHNSGIRCGVVRSRILSRSLAASPLGRTGV